MRRANFYVLTTDGTKHDFGPPEYLDVTMFDGVLHVKEKSTGYTKRQGTNFPLANIIKYTTEGDE